MTIIETLPANMTYVEGSAIPEPSEVSTDTRRLMWTANFVPTDGLTVTYQVSPQAVGRHPLSLGPADSATTTPRRECGVPGAGG
jgi:hypothetical protein